MPPEPPLARRGGPLTGLASLLGVKMTSPARIRSPGPGGPPLVRGVTHDSRRVRPGDLYAALPGGHQHGARVLPGRGVGRRRRRAHRPGRPGARTACALPVFVLADVRARLGEVAAWIYRHPSARLLLIGVTGTSGKTTTSYLLESGLRRAGHLTGLIGGVETRIAGETAPSELTTPEATDLQALFAVMAERGVTAAAMEVSSHALALGRVEGTSFDVAIFTNLSQDHLDFHANLETTSPPRPPCSPRLRRVGVVNIDDAQGRRLADGARIPVVTFSAAGDPAADWRAADVRCGADGSTFRVVGPGGVEADASVALPGPFNVANALGAVVALVEAGVHLATRWPASPPARGCPDGWSEWTRPGLHRPGGLLSQTGAVEAALRALRPVTHGRLAIVLGCGGDRDRAKRPLMGAAAASLADVAILTSDNPRSEDPLAILAEMLDGVPPSASRSGRG